MTEPRLTDQAEADLDDAWAHLSRTNRAAADRLIDAFVEAARLHARFPESGRARPEFGPDVRSFLVRPYVVFYHPAGDTIEVLRVLHGRRDIDRIIREGG